MQAVPCAPTTVLSCSRLLVVMLALAAPSAAAAQSTSARATAQGQIYAWRDAAGNLVLSDKAKDPAAQAYLAPRAGLFQPAARPSGIRTSRFDGLIEEQASAKAVNPALVRAVIQAESAFNPLATSHKGAMGLMQLMPRTAAELGVLDPYDPAENIRGGVTYLKQLLVKYGDNERLALAAYNAGPAAVARYGAVPPYRETRQYVEKVQRAAQSTPRGPKTRIYRTVEIVDGREVVRYTDVPAPAGQIVKAAERR